MPSYFVDKPGTQGKAKRWASRVDDCAPVLTRPMIAQIEQHCFQATCFYSQLPLQILRVITGLFCQCHLLKTQKLADFFVSRFDDFDSRIFHFRTDVVHSEVFQNLDSFQLARVVCFDISVALRKVCHVIRKRD